MFSRFVVLLSILWLVGCGPATEAEDQTMNITTANGWTFSGELLQGAAGATPGPAIGTQINFGQAKEPAGFYTIQFGLTSPPSGVGITSACNAVATIVWKLGGNSIQRKVNVANGVTISGPAEAVELSIVDNTDIGLLTRQRYVVAALISPGTRPSSHYPPRYFPGQFPQSAILAAGAMTSAFPIPGDAGVTSLIFGCSGVGVTLGPTVGALVVGFYDSNGNAIYSTDPITTPLMIVPSGAVSLQVFNVSANPVGVNWVYGIDG